MAPGRLSLCSLLALIASVCMSAAHAAPVQGTPTSSRYSHPRLREAGRNAREGSLVSLKLLDPLKLIKNKDFAKSVSLTAADASKDLRVVCMESFGVFCLSRLTSEFVDPVSEWDVVAVFVQEADGKLRRTSDNKCIAAVPQDGASWFDFQYLPCGSGSKWSEQGGRLSTTAAGKSVCMFSEEGYALLELCSAAPVPASSGGNSDISTQPASSQVDDNKSITAKIQDTMNQVFVGSFWEYAWDMSVGKSLAATDVKQAIDMRKINGYERSLGESVLECRGECDSLLWCTAFDFSATDKKCRLTATPSPKLSGKADAVSFVQNDLYNHSDFFLGS